jgi:hypothetical protein
MWCICPIGVVSGHTGRDDYIAEKVASYRAWQYINENLPADAVVLTFSGGDQFYSQRERISSDATLAHAAVWGAGQGDEDQAWQELQKLKVTHLLFDRRQIEQEAEVAVILREALSQNTLWNTKIAIMSSTGCFGNLGLEATV